MEIEDIGMSDFDDHDFSPSLPISGSTKIVIPDLFELMQPFEGHLRSSCLRNRHLTPLYLHPDVEDSAQTGALNLSPHDSRSVFKIGPKGVSYPRASSKFDLLNCHKHKKRKTFLQRCAHAVKKVGKGIGKGVEKVAHEVKDFVVEHKTVIIAAAAVVVGAAIVAGVVAAVSVATAEAVAEAATATLAIVAIPKKKEEEERPPINSLSLKKSDPPQKNLALLSGQELPPLSSPFDPLPGHSLLKISPEPYIPQSSYSPPPKFEHFAAFDSHHSPKIFSLDSKAKTFETPSLEIPTSQNKNIRQFIFLDPDHSPRFFSFDPTHLKQQEPVLPNLSKAAIAFIDPDSSPRIFSLDPPEPKRSKTFETSGAQLARGQIGGINGVGNDFKDAEGHAKYLKQLAGNARIQWVHNCSHTAPIDVLETVLFNYHGHSAPAELLKANWIEFDEQHKLDFDAKYLQYCHSQGSAAVRNALLEVPEHIRERIIVVAIAPAVIVPDDLCFRSFNYASKRDPVPFAEVALYAGSEDALVQEMVQEKLKLIREELILLDPHPDASTIDHEFQSPTFTEAIEKHLTEYIEKFGDLK